MTNSLTPNKYNVLFFQNPEKVDYKINHSGVSTCGNRAIASSIYEIYFNSYKQSYHNPDFYDPKRNAYYTICENATIKYFKHFNNNAISNGKNILRTLGLIVTVPQKWNSPDRIYLNGFKDITNSMRPNRASNSYTHSKNSERPVSKALLQKNNTTKIIYNSNNTSSNTSKNQKSKSNKNFDEKMLHAQKINRWIRATTNKLQTVNVTREHAHNLAVSIAKIANKDYDQAHYLFHVISSWWNSIQKYFNIGKLSRIGIENVKGLAKKLHHIWTYQLDPGYNRVSFKKYVGFVVNSLRKFYVTHAYHLKDSLDPYYFNEAKLDTGDPTYRPDNRPVKITETEHDKKGPHIPIIKI